MTTELREKLETLKEDVKSIHELLKGLPDNKAIETKLQEIETSVKQSKDIQKSIKNSVKDDEEEEMELGKQRDQIGDRKLMEEERKKSFETSSESIYNSALRETSGGENELATDVTTNALEREYSHASLDRQKNARFPDRVTSPNQSVSEGKYTAGSNMPAVNRTHFLLMGPISKLIVLEFLKKAFFVLFSLIHRFKSFSIKAD